MVLDYQLCGIVAVSDLYTVVFDSVDILRLEGFLQAQEDKKEQNNPHVLSKI